VVTLGVLSLVIWTLIVVTTIKYVSVAMRVDNDGEGGILALMSLLGVKRQHRPIIIAFGLFGAALIYGDGAITPAISVLSALEGLDIIFPAFAPYVLPVSVLILVALFAIQPQGTARLYGSRRSRCSGSGVSPGILRCFLRSIPGMGSAISSSAEVLDFSSSEGSSCA
jgi:K+ transporter